MMRLVKEPLVQFLALGLVVFLVYWFVVRHPSAEQHSKIVVPELQIEQLRSMFQATWQRPPTESELKNLVDEFVLEEAYFRQAVAMGLDQNDQVIRRHLRKKLESLTDDFTSMEPTDQQLGEFLDENRDRFRISNRYTFRQLYFNPEKHGPDPLRFVAELRDRLNQGAEPVGDMSLLPEWFEKASADQIDRDFGLGFAQKLGELEVGTWQGPVRSGLGLHLVRIDRRADGRVPNLAEIRPLLRREWINQEQNANRRRMNQQLLKQYEVIIEWPNLKAGESSSGVVPDSDDVEP